MKPMTELKKAPLGDSLSEEIKGITKPTEQALNDLGIYTKSDLLEYKHKGEQLAEQLRQKPDCKHITFKFITTTHDWFGQAEKQLRQEQPGESSNEAVNPVARVADDATKDLKSAALTPAKIPANSSKEPLASFVIAFYSDPQGRLPFKIEVSREGLFDRTWDDYDPTSDRLIKWVLEQDPDLSHLALPQVQPKPEPPVQTLAGEAVAIQLSDLEVDWMTAPVPYGNRRQMVLVAATCQMTLSGGAAHQLAENQLPYVVELFLVNTATNHSQQVSVLRGELEPNKLSYTALEQQFPAPPIGEYQLYAMAKLFPPGTAVSFIQGPLIEVG